MRRDYFFVWAGVVLAGVAFAAAAPIAFAVTMATGVGGALIYWFGRCRHGDRLGLLPPTAGEGGTRLPARWYCDQCGRTWPARFERDRAPIVRYTGYDQTKLPAAARRAAALTKQRQVLAVRRAGLVAPPSQVTPAVAASVTSINQRRAAR